MDNSAKFDWVDFYKELAGKLLQYKDNHQGLVDIVKKVYATTGINMPTLERDGNLIDIDPFTFFGLFNKKITDSNRKSFLTEVASLMGVNTPVPTAFEGIPVLNNQNATFYYFIDERGEEDIDDLWNLFESALTYSNNPTPENRDRISHYFDLTINRKGNGNSKITMGLYWIAPDSFLNLDSRNEWYIYKSGKVPEEIVNTLPVIESKIAASKYFVVLEKLRAYLQSDKTDLKDFKELSSAAWQYSEEVNEQNKKIEKESEGAAIADENVETVHYWIYSPGDAASCWDEFYNAGIMALGWDSIGNLKSYSSKEDMRIAMKDSIEGDTSFKNAAHATWQFANEMKPGDIVFAKKGMHLVIGRGVVESDYYYDESRGHYKNVRKVKWTHKGEWPHPGQAVMKTLTDITQYTEYAEKLNSLFESEVANDVEEQEVTYPAYDEDQFLEEVYMDAESYATLVSLVRNKKNVILQGAPGVGKTFAAQRLAYSMMGEKNKDRVMMVQFHQSYSYEDFIMGYRPTENGFERKAGAFYNFCKKAQDDGENDYFFIIDEINRGNLSKIFGELFMLIENDKRGIGLQLLYSNEKFSVPKNLYIIGMMNTADRSLAMLDYALRRRFAFYKMKPGFETKGFRDYQESLGSLKFDRLIATIQTLNEAIAADESLGEGFCIGHSYFCNLKEATDQALSEIIDFEIIPLLEEYWFDEPTKVKNWVNHLRSAIN